MSKTESLEKAQFLFFTVCNGRSRRVDNSRTEMLHRLLNRLGVEKQIVHLNEKRCFLIPYSDANRTLVNHLTSQYQTTGPLLHRDSLKRLILPNR